MGDLEVGPSRRKQQKEATAQRIFEAALQLFMTRGYDTTTVEAIAQAAGVAKGTFFVHFPSKQAVLEHMSRLQVQRMEAAMAAEPGFAALDFRAQVVFIFRALAAGVQQQKELVRQLAAVAMLQEQVLHPGNQQMDVFDAILSDLVVAGQERGQVRRDAAAATLAQIVRGIYFTALLAWLQQDHAPDDDSFATLAERYLTLVFEGILTPT